MHCGLFFVCTDPSDVYYSKLIRVFWALKQVFMNKNVLKMANNLAQLKMYIWQKHLFWDVANKFDFPLVWGLNLYIYLTLNSLDKFQNNLLYPNLYDGKIGTLHHPEVKNSHFCVFSRLLFIYFISKCFNNQT